MCRFHRAWPQRPTPQFDGHTIDTPHFLLRRCHPEAVLDNALQGSSPDLQPCHRDVRFELDSDRTADVAVSPSRAKPDVVMVTQKLPIGRTDVSGCHLDFAEGPAIDHLVLVPIYSLASSGRISKRAQPPLVSA
jgi:hypothetical protein